MRSKRMVAVIGLSIVAALALTAWVVLSAPPADTSLFTVERAEAAFRAEIDTPLVNTATMTEPTTEQLYAAGHGELPPPKAATQSFTPPTSADLYAARGGVWD